MNRITELFKNKPRNILSIYCTAGYPALQDTTTILEELERSGADMIELGIPFSDPLADGPVIQGSSEAALKNGMSLKLLFEQIKDIRKTVSVPILLMGYLNPVLQYGMSNFVAKCAESGIDGVIIPDLPLDEYLGKYKEEFTKHNLFNIFLVTPQTSVERIKIIDKESNGFIYLVSSSSITGNTISASDAQSAYFEKVRSLNLKNPSLVGFGIGDRKSFDFAASYSSGAIIGSAFIKAISQQGDLRSSVREFVQRFKN